MGIIGDLANINLGLDRNNTIQKDLIDKADNISQSDKNSLIADIDRSGSATPSNWRKPGPTVANQNQQRQEEIKKQTAIKSNLSTANRSALTQKDRDAAALAANGGNNMFSKWNDRRKSVVDESQSPLTTLTDAVNNWANEQAPTTNNITHTDVDGEDRVTIEPEKSRFADEVENSIGTDQWANGGYWGYYSSPLDIVAQAPQAFFSSIAQLPQNFGNAVWGDPEWGYSTSNGDTVKYDDLENVADSILGNGYLLSSDSDDENAPLNQVYEDSNNVYTQLPNGSWVKMMDTEGNPYWDYDQDTDMIKFSEGDEIPLEEAQNLSTMTYGKPVDTSQGVGDSILPNSSSVSWNDLLGLINGDNSTLHQLNPGILNLNKQRQASDSNDPLQAIADVMPEDLGDLPNWLLRITASSAPYMIPAVSGPNAILSGLSNAHVSSMGLDPNSYDAKTNTYAAPTDETKGSRALRAVGNFVDPTIDAVMGVGGDKLAQAKLKRAFKKATKKNDFDDLEKAKRKLERNTKYPIIPVLKDVAEEGIEEVPGQYIEHLGSMGDISNIGMNQNEDGSYDQSTSIPERAYNEIVGNMAPDFLAGALYGGILKGPNVAGSTMMTASNIKDSYKQKKDKFKDYTEGTERQDLTPKIKQFLADYDEEE